MKKLKIFDEEYNVGNINLKNFKVNNDFEVYECDIDIDIFCNNDFSSISFFNVNIEYAKKLQACAAI